MSSTSGDRMEEMPPRRVFCSFARDQKDEALLRELEQQLLPQQRTGRLVLWHRGQIQAGENSTEILRHWETQAEVILLLVSPAFLASDDCAQETHRAIERQRAGDARVIPVIIRPCAWQGTAFDDLQCLPHNKKAVSAWRNRDHAWQDVTAGLRAIFDEVFPMITGTPPAAGPAYWNVPVPRNPFFIGQDAFLERLHARLWDTQTAAYGQFQAISGMGGIGKTQLAVEYAYRYRHEYQAVLWAHAESAQSLAASYVNIAALLQLPARNAQEQEVTLAAVKTWLQTQRRWLLLLDNADEPDLCSAFLPTAPGGHVLITTRVADLSPFGLGFGHAMEVQTLDAETGAQLLLQRAGLLAAAPAHHSSQSLSLARQLSRTLGGLPLALDQAGAYLAATQTDLRTYQQWYQQYRARLLAERRGREHPASVAATLSLSFQQVAARNPASADLLRLCAYLSPDTIPETILTHCQDTLEPFRTYHAADTLWFSQAIAILRAYSLVKRDGQRQILLVHHLVQAVLQDSMGADAQAYWAERALLAVNSAFPRNEYASWPQCEQLLPQALVVIEHSERFHLLLPEAGRLLNETASYLQDRARYTTAEPLYLRALALRTQLLGPEHLDVATSLNGLANLYAQQSKEAEAEPLYQQALAIREHHLGSEHPDVATLLNNLAILSQRQAKETEAEQLYQRALRIWKQLPAHRQSDVAYPLTGLASLYRKQGAYAKAEPLYQQALAIREQQLGPDHPLVASPLNNLAGLYRVQGKMAEAEALYQRALRILEQQLGLEHPDVVYPLIGLAILYHAQGRHIAAEVLYQRALQIWQQGAKPSEIAASNTMSINLQLDE
ncbi:MAG TPA: tetratricopeptide repeat protein [Ktedonobacteraceae bacterium]